jgi:glucose-1-phosphate thymidylyltransferase
MIPLAGGRPFLDYVLHALADAGIERVALVLGPEHDSVRHYYRAQRRRRLAVDFVTQHEPLGTADAVASAEPWTGGASFLVLNADNLYPADVLSRLVDGTAPAAPGFERDSLRLPLEKIGTYALLAPDPQGCLARIVEKPGEAVMREAGPAALISMNIWRFDDRIFEACRTVPVSPRGERELPQAVGLAASRGMCIEVFPVRGEVLDLSRRSDVAHVARRLQGLRVDL